MRENYQCIIGKISQRIKHLRSIPEKINNLDTIYLVLPACVLPAD